MSDQDRKEIEQMQSVIWGSDKASERSPVRSDTFVSPPTQDADTRHDAPISPSQAATRSQRYDGYEFYHEQAAAKSDKELIDRFKWISQLKFELKDYRAAAEIDTFIDRFLHSRAAANGPTPHAIESSVRE